MLHSKLVGDSLEPADVLLDCLLSDRKFRKVFLKNPLMGIEKLGIKLEPNMVASLRNFHCPPLCRDVAKFNEKLVLCSSAPD